jgi:hypothetical protein
MDCGASSAAKQLRVSEHAERETALLVWFFIAGWQFAIIMDAVLREKANQFGAELNVTDFHLFERLAAGFKSCVGISNLTFCS